jgi:hypothetical protein
MRLHIIKMFLHHKQKNHYSEDTAYGMEKNCQMLIC